MFKKIFVLICLLFSFYFLRAQSQLWRVGTALTLPKHWFDKGVFQPLRYGLTSRTELSAYPVVMFFMPNIAIKHRWYRTQTDWFISTKHGIYYPSMLLKRVQGQEIWSLLPARSEVPFLLPNYHELLGSKFLKPGTSCTAPDLLLTLKLGAKVSIGKSTEEQMPSIDYPFLYHTTQPYFGKLLWYLGADLEGHLNDFLNFSVDLDLQSVGAVASWNVSHKGLLVWPWTDRWTLAAGYKADVGKYPWGCRLAVVPLVDVSYKFTFRRKAKVEQGLFKRFKFKHDDFQEKNFKLEQEEHEEYFLEEQELDQKRRKVK